MTQTPKRGTATRARISKGLTASGRSARRTRYRCRYEYSRTYAGNPIEEDATVCLECTKPADKCNGEYLCYLHQKRKRERMRERQKKKDPSEYLLEQWKPTGIYDIWGENL